MDKKIFKGLGVSAGIARGPVRVIDTHMNHRLFRDGDVLVTKITDPSMVALMARASAIVCEIGSMTSHPSIVSREMGIPCVVRLGSDIAALQNGTMVEVNGATGGVEILSDKEEMSVLDTPAEHPLDTQSIDQAIQSCVSACAEMDFRTFDVSVSWFRYDPLIANTWTARVLQMIRDCCAAGFSHAEIGRLFPNMSDLRNKWLFDAWMSTYAAVTEKERKEIFSFYDRMVRAVCVDDPYAVSRNVIHTPEEVSRLVAETQPANAVLAKHIGRAVSACYHFGHAAFSDMNPANVYENYGPYDVSDVYGPGHTMVIKQFTHLRPSELWPGTKTLPCETVTFVCVYKDVDMAIDFISHVTYSGDLIRGLVAAGVFVDGERVDWSVLPEISAELEEKAASIFRRFQRMTLEEKKTLYYYQKAYGYRGIYDALGQDWRPSAEILNEAKDRSLCGIVFPEDRAGRERLLADIFDPRVEVERTLLWGKKQS